MTPQEKEALRIKIINEAERRIHDWNIYFYEKDVLNAIDAMPETELTTAQAWAKIAEDYDQEPEELHDILENATFYGGKGKKTKVPKWFNGFQSW